MTNFISLVKKEFTSYYQDLSYCHPREVNLENEYERYSIARRPEVMELIHSVLQTPLPVPALNGKSLNTLLQNNYDSFHKNNIASACTIYNREDNKSIVLEHPEAPGWLLKQNYRYAEVNGNFGLLLRYILSNRVPFWLFHFKTWHRVANLNHRGLSFKNSDLNPLRVVLLKRARQCIKKNQLDKVLAVKEYLYRFSDYHPNDAIDVKFLVISKKVPILNERESQRRFIQLARRNPNELKKIIAQVATVIKNTSLSDMHLNNIRFMDDGTNRVCLFDGEPLGGVCDTSTSFQNKKFDFALPCILGLRVLVDHTSNCMREMGWEEADVEAVSSLIKEVVDPLADEIICERRNYYFKLIASFMCPLYPLALLALAVSRTALKTIFNPIF
ncbi:MAG: hypothetical protein LW832_01625 [Parachlamydia sp.]|jgi:hypothetical protein|nr:hypothetical protein [Parachlamydia sp.]